MLFLKSNLTKWKNEGLIDENQIIKIEEFERVSSYKLAYAVLFSAAGLLLSLSFISLVAYNWYKLGDILKLLCDFMIFGVVALSALRLSYTKHVFWTDFFLILSYAMIGATIGLIGQIFHLDGTWYNLALSWSILGLPYALMSKGAVLRFFWSGIMLSSLYWDDIFKFCYKGDSTNKLLNTLVIVCIMYILACSAEFLYKSLKNKIPLLKTISQSIIILMYAFAFFVPFFERISYDVEFTSAFFIVLGIVSLFRRNMLFFRNNIIVALFYAFIRFFNSNYLDNAIGFAICGIIAIIAVYLIKRYSGFFIGRTKRNV